MRFAFEEEIQSVAHRLHVQDLRVSVVFQDELLEEMESLFVVYFLSHLVWPLNTKRFKRIST